LGTGDGAAERLGGKIMSALESRGYVAVAAEEAGAWAHMRHQNEVLLATIHVLAGFEDPHTRTFAVEAMRRLGIPDGATPFDDMRMQIRALEDENRQLRETLERAGDVLNIVKSR
jgi:hypothetical protein